MKMRVMATGCKSVTVKVRDGGDGYFLQQGDYHVGRIKVSNLSKELLAHEILHTFGLDHTETGIMGPNKLEWDFSLVPDLCGVEED